MCYISGAEPDRSFTLRAASEPPRVYEISSSLTVVPSQCARIAGILKVL
jgi:hypothetical protein